MSKNQARTTIVMVIVSLISLALGFLAGRGSAPSELAPEARDELVAGKRRGQPRADQGSQNGARKIRSSKNSPGRSQVACGPEQGERRPG